MDYLIVRLAIFDMIRESTFSVGGRVIDQYRSSLKHDIIEALVRTRKWLYKNQSNISYLHI
jgi:hypothetical protein